MSELVVVPTERHVERLAREGARGETRSSLRSRLASALLPDVAFADAREARLAVAMALSDPAARAHAAQLDLFGGLPAGAEGAAESPAIARSDDAADDAGPLLRAVRRRGGASWAKTTTALDDALGVLRARGVDTANLERVARTRGFLGARARALVFVSRSLDARLARAGARDGRLVGRLLEGVIREAPAEVLEELCGARVVRARWILVWEPDDAAWWRALDEKLAPRGGGARVILPAFDRPIALDRERDPLEALAEEVSRELDAPLESEIIEPVLGDLTGGVGPENAAVDVTRVRHARVSDAVAQASLTADAVSRALDAGASVERVVVALPSLDERTLAPLRLAFEARGIVAHEGRGAPPSASPVVSVALLALEAARSMDRRTVARLLRSGWLDAVRLASAAGAPAPSPREAERRVTRLARRLENVATAAGEDDAARLLATFHAAPERGRGEGSAEREGDLRLATELVATLVRARGASTRGEHARAARGLFASLGIGARAGRGGLSTFARDEPPVGVARAERLAIARDARAWETLAGALDLYEATADRLGASEQGIAAEAFELELLELAAASVTSPGAGRAAAVRVARLADVPGDELDLLVVLDAVEGVLPRDDGEDALVSSSLLEALARASRGAFVAPARGARRTRDLAALAMAVAGAREVILVAPREDSAGAPSAASTVVLAAERAGAPALDAEVGVSPSHDRASPISASVLARVARERVREGFFLDPARPRSSAVGAIDVAPVASSLLVSETGGGARSLAVTSLERFARCAFMGFSHVVLGAREGVEQGELPDAREEGTLVHEALAAAFVATRELWPVRPRDERAIFARGRAAAAAVLDRWQGHAKLRAVVRLRVADSVDAVLRAGLDDDTWNFELAEQPFGASAEQGWPAYLVEDGGVRLALRGTIDRVDTTRPDGLGRRRARVIDYKRSRSTVRDASGSLGETALQVPLYAAVAVGALARSGVADVTGIYAPTQARDVPAGFAQNAKVEARMEELLRAEGGGALTPIARRALDVVTRVRQGGLVPEPASEAECRLCAFSGGCRKPRFAMEPLDEGGGEE